MVSAAGAQFRRDTLTLILDGGQRRQVIDIEIAETDEQKSRGLMFRNSIGETEGMLFLYDKPQEITMWMRNTLIPLDMVFIRGDGSVLRIEAMTEPFSEATIASGGPATAVLELKGGAAGRLGLKPGDRVEHRFFTSARK